MSWNWTPNETATRSPLLRVIVCSGLGTHLVSKLSVLRLSSVQRSLQGWLRDRVQLPHLSTLLIPSRCNQSKQSHEWDSYRLFFFFFACYLWGRLYPPITKVMLENWLEKRLCLWGSQTRQQMGVFSWDLIQKTDKFKTFAPYGRWSISHSSLTHMRNRIREQRKGKTNAGKKM